MYPTSIRLLSKMDRNQSKLDWIKVGGNTRPRPPPTFSRPKGPLAPRELRETTGCRGLVHPTKFPSFASGGHCVEPTAWSPLRGACCAQPTAWSPLRGARSADVRYASLAHWPSGGYCVVPASRPFARKARSLSGAATLTPAPHARGFAHGLKRIGSIYTNFNAGVNIHE